MAEFKRKLAKRYIYAALLKKLKELGYKTGGDSVFPRVEVYGGIESRPSQKNNQDGIVTINLDVITSENQPNESLIIADDLIENLDDSLEIEGWRTIIVQCDNVTELHETTETEKDIYRQVMTYDIEALQNAILEYYDDYDNTAYLDYDNSKYLTYNN